jgi:hypothetical protein
MGDRRITWFMFGATVALLIAALGAPARAQERLRSTVNSTSTPPSVVNQNTASQALDDGYAAPGIPPPIPPDDPGEVQPEQDGLDPVPRAGQRPITQDGDLSIEQGGPMLRDGIVDVGEPLPPEDGTDPSSVDTRPQEDIEPFQNPSSGVDPLLFQIEDLDPVRDDRRTARLFRAEPYDPIGIRIGSFVMFPELELGGSWYSNVFRAPNAASDGALDLKPSTRLVSNWARHALEFRGNASLSYFDEFDTENDQSYLAEARGRLDITRRTNVQALVSYEQAPESRSALDASSVGTRSEQSIGRGELALNHRFNRLSLQFRGSVADFAYGDTKDLGVTTSNEDRNYRQTEELVRATWEFKPTLSVFTEVAVNQRAYETVASTDLIERSSDGQRYRVGVSFGNTGQVLRGEISLGYGVQTPDDSRLDAVDGLIFDANATWRASELTSFLLTARSDVSETTTPGVGGAFSRSVGIEARHSLRRYLVASAGLIYSTQDSQDGVIDESELTATLGLEYFANRETVIYGRYAHASFDAVGSGSDYESDEIHLGVRIRR